MCEHHLRLLLKMQDRLWGPTRLHLSDELQRVGLEPGRLRDGRPNVRLGVSHANVSLSEESVYRRGQSRELR